MSVIFIALPATLALAAFFVIAFVLCAKRGQFEDLETPAIRMLFDDDE
jgi:cbb3-type cytochrome oxidase maturation protein